MLSAAIKFLMAALVLFAAAVQAWQLVLWLKTGIWEDVSIGAIFQWIHISAPQTSWVGLQRVIEIVFSLPFPAAGLVILFFFSSRIIEWLVDAYEWWEWR